MDEIGTFLGRSHILRRDAPQVEPEEDKVKQLTDMGFDQEDAK